MKPLPRDPATRASAAAEAHDGGLLADLERLHEQVRQRRRTLAWLAGLAGGAGTLGLIGCGGGTATTGSTTGSSSGSTGGSTGGTTGSCSVIPEETAGPYPGDGSNTSNGSIANVLAFSGVVRSDIRSSIAGATGTAAGVPLSISLHLVNTGGSCADLSGYAIYLWHCDREGRYSMYSSGVTGENYLRGVQVTGSDGIATFSTIFPGCYDGRMPHMHFEIYKSATSATLYSNKLRTSQIAFPNDVSTQVYTNASGYASSLTNLGRISFATDNVFSDGYTTQLATLSGSVSQGYTGSLTVGISA